MRVYMPKTDHGEIRIRLDDNNIIIAEYVKIPQDEEKAFELWYAMQDEIRARAQGTGQEMTPVLVDTRMPDDEYRTFSSRERKGAMGMVKTPYLGPWAVVGESPFMKLASGFISAAAGKHIKWFTDRDKAYQWLLKMSDRLVMYGKN